MGKANCGDLEGNFDLGETLDLRWKWKVREPEMSTVAKRMLVFLVVVFLVSMWYLLFLFDFWGDG